MASINRVGLEKQTEEPCNLRGTWIDGRRRIIKEDADVATSSFSR